MPKEPVSKPDRTSHDIEPGDDFADMDAAVKVDAEPWLPISGDRLFGSLIAIDEAESEFGPYPILFVMTPEGKEVAFHAFHTVAQTAIKRANPQPGDRIGVMYKGPKEGSGTEGRSAYENYRVVVRPPRTADTF